MKHHRDEPRIWATRDSAHAEPIVRTFVKEMRANPTEAEKKLWRHLRHSLPGDAHFRRQVQIGNYVADFLSHRAKLIIEVDGGQHASVSDADAARARFFEQRGFRMLRFWNNDVLSNVEGVLETIAGVLANTTPTPDPSPQGGGEKNARD